MTAPSVPTRSAVLSYGPTRYRLAGPAESDLVVLIHGYSAPSPVWGPLEARPATAGHATLSYDLYGHGGSAKPRLRYCRELFTTQLADLIAQVAPGRRLHLVGWSMGAMVATGFALAHPDRVASLFFVSPSGLPIRVGALGRVAFVPILGDVGFALIGARGLRAAQRNFFESAAAHAAYLPVYDAQAAAPGFHRAMLSTLRSMRMDDFRSGYAALGHSGLPVDVVWATGDRATPFSNSALFRSLVPQATVQGLDGVGHASQLDDPDLVAGYLLRWLGGRR